MQNTGNELDYKDWQVPLGRRFRWGRPGHASCCDLYIHFMICPFFLHILNASGGGACYWHISLCIRYLDHAFRRVHHRRPRALHIPSPS